MPAQTVKSTDIKQGDIISFVNFQGNQGQAHNQPRAGFVFNVIRGQGQIKGYEVFEFEPVDKRKRIERSREKFILGSGMDEVKEQIGLNPHKNYCLHYKVVTVANHPRHLGSNQADNVTRLGTSIGTEFCDNTFRHARSLDLHHNGIIGIDDELRHLSGERAREGQSQQWDRSGLFERGERGANVGRERARQDSGAPIDIREVVIPAAKKLRKTKPLYGKGDRFDISLEDAAKIGLITQEIKEILSQKPRGRGRQKPLTTLKEAFDLARQAPEKLDRFLPEDRETISLNNAHKEGYFSDSEHTIIQNALLEEGKKKVQLSMREVHVISYLDPERIVGNIEEDERAQEILDAIDETYGSLETGDNSLTTTPEMASQLETAWKSFMDDVVNSRTNTDPKYEGIQIKYPAL